MHEDLSGGYVTQMRMVGIDGCIGLYESLTPGYAAWQGAREWFDVGGDGDSVDVQVNDSQGSHYFVCTVVGDDIKVSRK